MSEDKMLNTLNEITEIVLSNSICDKLALKKVTDDKLEAKKKYKEVFISDASMIGGKVSQTALQVANQGMTLAEIAKQAPNGLFTATANPANLSKFANGTTTTMVRDASGHLVEHAGFANIGLNVSVNPQLILSAGMQAMSAISGTYYLHKLNTQIKDLETQLENLQNFHHDANIGRLLAVKKRLSEFANRDFFDTTDLSAISNYKNTADEIHEEYMFRLIRQKKKLNLVINTKAEEQKLQDINFTMEIALEANKLSLFAELIEVRTKMKTAIKKEIINDSIKQLKQNYANSFYHNSEIEVEKTYAERQHLSSKEMVEKKKEFVKSVGDIKELHYLTGWEKLGVGINIGKDYWKANKLKKRIKLEKEYLSTVKTGIEKNKESDGIGNIIDMFFELPHKETEILYIPAEDNKQRVFVLIEDN